MRVFKVELDIEGIFTRQAKDFVLDFLLLQESLELLKFLLFADSLFLLQAILFQR